MGTLSQVRAQQQQRSTLVASFTGDTEQRLRPTLAVSETEAEQFRRDLDRLMRERRAVQQ